MKSNIYRQMLKIVAVMIGFAGISANAQDALEEIIVTAQKRAQNVQDVPIAVSAFTDEMMQRASIKDIRDVSFMDPSFTSAQSQTATNSSFSIRGVGTSSQNFGLEAAVGVFIDGVHRSRPSAAINNLVDMESVEILRGPQGTLFGKNTSAGAINFRTKTASHEKDGFVEVNAGDMGLMNVSAAQNFSLKDDVLAMRATVFSGNRHGYITNIAPNASGDKLNDRDRAGARLSFLYTPNDTWDVTARWDYAKIDENCCGSNTKMNNFTNLAGTAAGGDTYLALGLGTTVVQASKFEDNIINVTGEPHSTNHDRGFSLEINKHGDTSTLTSISAVRNFDTTDYIDADFAEADLLYDTNTASQSSFSQEFRLSGEFGNGGNYVVGAYFFSQDIDNNSRLDLGIHTDGFLGLDPTLKTVKGALAAIYTGTQAGLTAAYIADPTLLGLPAATPLAADTMLPTGITLTQLAGLPAGGNPYPTGQGTPFPADQYANDKMSQDHTSKAFFAHADFPLNDKWGMAVGVRYTDEEKDLLGAFTNGPIGAVPDLRTTGPIIQTLGAVALGLINPVTSAASVLAALAPLYEPGWGLYVQPSLAPHAGVNETVDDDALTGTFKITYKPNDSTMLYGSYANGYKSGGTNTDRLGPGLKQVFGPETTESLEIGLKMDLETMRVNLAVHKTNSDDLQVNAFAGNAFNLQNAGKFESHGFETDVLWVPMDGTSIQFNWAHLKGTVKDFETGSCWIAYTWQTGLLDPGANGDADAAVCDRSGEPIYAPENVGYAAFTQEFGNSYVRLEWRYEGEVNTGNNDPYKMRDSKNFINARIGTYLDNLDAELALWGRNLGDEHFYESIYDVPVQDGKLNAFPHEGRTWGVIFRKNFN